MLQHPLLWIALLASSALTGCLAAETNPSNADPGPGAAEPSLPSFPLRYTGTGCKEIFFMVDVPAASVRSAVPSRFALSGEATGRATLAVGAVHCDNMEVPGRAGAPGRFSDVGVQLEDPDGSGGFHFYQLWQVTDHEGLRDALGPMGLFGGLVPGISFEASDAGGRAEVPWERAAYVLEAQAVTPAPTPLDVPFASTWWHEGDNGLIRAQFVLPGPTHALTGEVRAEPETPLAELMGADSSPASGFLPAFNIEATVEIVEDEGTRA